MVTAAVGQDAPRPGGGWDGPRLIPKDGFSRKGKEAEQQHEASRVFFLFLMPFLDVFSIQELPSSSVAAPRRLHSMDSVRVRPWRFRTLRPPSQWVGCESPKRSTGATVQTGGAGMEGGGRQLRSSMAAMIRLVGCVKSMTNTVSFLPQTGRLVRCSGWAQHTSRKARRQTS